MNKEIIKEFREKFVGNDGRVYSGTLTAGKMEKWITSKLKAQREDLLKEIEGILKNSTCPTCKNSDLEFLKNKLKKLIK